MAERRKPSAVGPLLALALPMLIGQAGQVALQLTDTAMLGRVDATSLAGAALAGNFVMFALYFAYGALGAVAPKIAQAFGAGDIKETGRIARGGLALAACVGLVVALALSALVPLLPFFGQPPDVVRVTGGYLALLAWSMPAALISLVLGQTAEALNRPWPVVAIMAGAIILNAGLNGLLIFGHLGFPALGLEGAGWATLIARCVQAAALAVWIVKSRQWKSFGVFRRPDGARLRCLWSEGLPIAGQDVLEGGAFAVGSLVVGWFGTIALAANQVAISIASLAWMFPIALAGATSVRVAHAVGAGDRAGARRSGLAGVGIGTGLMAVCAVVYIGGGRHLARLFTSDPDVEAFAAVLVTIAGLYQISDAVQSVSLGALRGLLDTRVPLVANALCYWVLSLPSVYLVAVVLNWGAVGVWIGFLPWMALTGVFFLFRFLYRTKPIE